MTIEGELKEFCVVCLSACLYSNAYISVRPKETVTLTVRGIIVDFTILAGEDRQIHQWTAGRPGALIAIARTIGRENMDLVLINHEVVNLWAQLEWFGLRVCAPHLNQAQELWKSGGNRNWR